jgi:integrase/recombinase XerD
MLETLYGLRPARERISQPAPHQSVLAAGFIKVTGKGNKERLVPIGPEAGKYIEQYLQYVVDAASKHQIRTRKLCFSQPSGRPS